MVPELGRFSGIELPFDVWPMYDWPMSGMPVGRVDGGHMESEVDLTCEETALRGERGCAVGQAGLVRAPAHRIPHVARRTSLALTNSSPLLYFLLRSCIDLRAPINVAPIV